MCLGIPGKILSIQDVSPRMGSVDFDGVTRDVCLAYVPEASLGDYVLVHVGFAINMLDEIEALETLEILKQLGAAEEL